MKSPNKQMKDILPFEHGSEGTHSACQEQIDKYGGKAQCCECSGHKCKPINPNLDKDKQSTLSDTNLDKQKMGTRTYEQTLETVERIAKTKTELDKQKNIRDGSLEATRSSPRDILHMIFCNYRHGHWNAPKNCDQEENLDEAMRVIDSIIDEVIGENIEHEPRVLGAAHPLGCRKCEANRNKDEQRNKWKQMKGTK